MRDDFVQVVRKALAASGLPPQRLEIEITESLFIDASPKALRNLETLRQMGIRVALDDFGTGYSSLAYLRQFPFDTLKIDRAFVRELVTQHDARAIVRSIVELAAALGMSTVAEGVEEPGAVRVAAPRRLPRRAGLPDRAADADRPGRRDARELGDAARAEVGLRARLDLRAAGRHRAGRPADDGRRRDPLSRVGSRRPPLVERVFSCRSAASQYPVWVYDEPSAEEHPARRSQRCLRGGFRSKSGVFCNVDLQFGAPRNKTPTRAAAPMSAPSSAAHHVLLPTPHLLARAGLRGRFAMFSTGAWAADTGNVCVYADINYGGAHTCVDADTAWIGSTWNDKASSVRLRAGWQATLFDDINYGGRSLALAGDTANLVSPTSTTRLPRCA